MASDYFKNFIFQVTNSSSIQESEIIQSLWSGYGKIIRFSTNSKEHESIVVKHVRFPDTTTHPRGWNTDLSHHRKVKSYKIEQYFYEHYSNNCRHDLFSYLPKCLGVSTKNDEVLMVLEDLNFTGYSLRKESATLSEAKLCLSWLANFHANFLNVKPIGIWKTGTYWHLETRPDELKALEDQKLIKAAPIIDQQLENCQYKTFVHGDAKLANFCFAKNGKSVSAVDFQYVGGGCGIKDVAYFIGSCFNEHDLESLEKEILNYYFAELKNALNRKKIKIDFPDLKREWEYLYSYAWADFHRFLMGWSPGHWKINSYSQKILDDVTKNCI